MIPSVCGERSGLSTMTLKSIGELVPLLIKRTSRRVPRILKFVYYQLFFCKLFRSPEVAKGSGAGMGEI